MMDWSATAAWIALIVSITGTIASPLITTCLTNRHQLKLRKLAFQQKMLQKYEERRFQAINSFFQKVGSVFARFDEDSLAASGSAFYGVYQYVPQNLWGDLDELYNALTNEKWSDAKKLYPPIAHQLSELLKEPPQLNP